MTFGVSSGCRLQCMKTDHAVGTQGRSTQGGWMLALGLGAGDREDWPRPDLVACLKTAAVVVPKAMTCATVGSLSAEETSVDLGRRPLMAASWDQAHPR